MYNLELIAVNILIEIRNDTSVNYTEEVTQGIQKRYLYISVNYSEEVREGIHKRYIYIPISQLHRGGKTRYAKKVPIYINRSITQRK
jgi:hypothetical protein